MTLCYFSVFTNFIFPGNCLVVLIEISRKTINFSMENIRSRFVPSDSLNPCPQNQSHGPCVVLVELSPFGRPAWNQLPILSSDGVLPSLRRCQTFRGWCSPWLWWAKLGHLSRLRGWCLGGTFDAGHCLSRSLVFWTFWSHCSWCLLLWPLLLLLCHFSRSILREGAAGSDSLPSWQEFPSNCIKSVASKGAHTVTW